MRATGIVRRIDDLGRVVIPKELRRHMGIVEGDPLEVFTTNEGRVILQKYHENEPEKNGLKVSAEPKEEECQKVTIRDTDSNKIAYLNLSKSAWLLLCWLEKEGFFHYDVSFSEGHDIDTENFLEKGD